MTTAKTLLELAGANLVPADIASATLILIDMQNEYCNGPIAVTGADKAVAHARLLLDQARAQSAPIIHIAHKGSAGGLFDRMASRGQIIADLSPQSGETVIEKTLPNAFAGTSLMKQLTDFGRKDLVLAGFMTHMCVSTTARAAIDHGYRVTIDADACATRDLPDGAGGVVPAALLHRIALIELSDRFAIIRHSSV